MRGRLHHTFFAEILMISNIETRKDPDGAGALTSGYDDDFDEIMVFTGPKGREEARRDEHAILVECNIETDSWEAMQQYAQGNTPDTNIIMIVHRRELERKALINVERGEPIIRVNDKLVSIRDRCQRVVYRPREPFYVTQVRPTFGIGTTPDLFNFTLEDREQAVRG
jgi:hypothetical protein